VEFRLLGPLEVLVDGRSVPLVRRKERCLLAVLVLQTGRPIAVGRLAELLWNGHPPEYARRALQTYVSRLRTALEAAGATSDVIRLMHSCGGYVAHTDPDSVDADCFRRIVRRAQATHDPRIRSNWLRQALELWRGEPIPDFEEGWARESICGPLEQLRRTALELRVEADLVLGEHDAVIEELVGLTATRTVSERLVASLMTAQYRTGHQQDALETYRRTRDRLAHDLGLDPGAELQQLHVAMLRGDPALFGFARKASQPDVACRVPRQLPTAPVQLVGRTKELAGLHDQLGHQRRREDALGPAAVVITGMGGIGKTALAIRLAAEASDDYPDGCLYAQLHEANGVPVPAAVALGGFLRALGVPAETLGVPAEALGVPAKALAHDVAQLSATFRTVTAGRRLLVVLDNAADEAQVRQLAPGGAYCAMIVTSRSSLAGLDGVHRLTLELLPDGAATELLATHVGADRVAAEPAALRRVVAICGGLPLALRVVGGRLSEHPGWSMTDLAERLHDERGRLDELVCGDWAVRACLAISYRQLTEPARRLFGLLGLLPWPALPGWIAGALLDVPERAGEQILHTLVDAQLLHEGRAGGASYYRMHDLVRLHAAEIGEAAGSRAASDALRRVYETLADLAVRAETGWPGDRRRSGRGASRRGQRRPASPDRGARRVRRTA
jgi:DNA-binding SARP family transcriptional activator